MERTGEDFRVRTTCWVKLCVALAAAGCVKNPQLPGAAREPDIAALASRPCDPIRQVIPLEPSVRVTFMNSAPTWPVDIYLLSIEERCAHLVPVMSDERAYSGTFRAAITSCVLQAPGAR